MEKKYNVKHPLNRSIILAGAIFIVLLGIVISAATILVFRNSMYARYEKQMESILNYVEAHIDHDDMAEYVQMDGSNSTWSPTGQKRHFE